MIRVVAIERNVTRHFKCLADCCKEFGFRTSDELLIAIVNNRTWIDGYTTFDFDIDVPDDVVTKVCKRLEYKREGVV